MFNRKLILIASLISLLALMVTSNPTQADEFLPASSWYGVVWNRTADTLHWFNSVTEVASIQRPKLPNEAQPSTGTDVYISPDGRKMVVIAGLQNGRLGIGFYDFQSGQFIQTHEAQDGEMIAQGDDSPFSTNGEYVALGFFGQDSWRVIAFETATGNVIGQLDKTNPNIPNQLGDFVGVPRIVHYDVEESLGNWRVHIRLVLLGPAATQPYQPTITWLPFNGMMPAINSVATMAIDYDIIPQQDRIVYAELINGLDPSQGTHILSTTMGFYDNLAPVFNQNNVSISDVEWIANGLMIAFRAIQDPYMPMWYLMPSVGGEAVPFAPDYERLYGTSDGFMIVDVHEGEIKFSNTLQVQAFAPTVGTTVFTTDTSNFSVIYVTPMGTNFQLASIATPNNDPVFDTPDNVQAPQQTCGTAPTPRLTVGQGARVTFTNGVPLNVRANPAGTLMTQLAEGTGVMVVEGPVCAEGYFWWRLEFASPGDIAGGWVAEGDADEYYIEPMGIVQQPQFAPTELPQLQVATIQPTPMGNLGLAPQPTPVPPLGVAAQPTATPQLGVVAPAILGDGNCSNAPAQTGISNGQIAHTVNISGTLAMRTNLNDQFPSYQIPNNTSVNVQSNGVCNGGFRMWRVSLTLNGQQVTGWISDGFGQTEYLRKGLARAN